MLAGRAYQGFVAVSDPDRARDFYVGTLGLPLLEASPVAIVVDAGGTPLRLTVVPGFTPQPFTVAGWEVSDLEWAVDELARLGVEVARFAGLDHDERGVWRAPGGDEVVWFFDPDGNTLSLTRFID